MRNPPARMLVETFFLGMILSSLMVFMFSCGGKPPADPFCSYEALPAGADVKSGQGGLQVEGTTSAYFYVFNETGKQVSYQALGKTLGLDSGKYQVKVNNSAHTVTVQGKTLTKCSTGTLMASGATSDYYYVLDNAGQQMHYDAIGKASSFFPSTFQVKVNNTEAPTELKLNQVTEVKTGTLVVRGTSSEYYYVVDSLGKQLNYNGLEKPLAFLPGTYDVKVNNIGTKVTLVGGQVTELKTGTLLVKGATDEYYYVFDALGKQLAYQGLNKSLAFFPGSFRVTVNKTDINADVVAGEVKEYETGSLMVAGGGNDYFYVLDKNGNQLNYNSTNKALSFFPGSYTVKLKESTHPATVTAGQITSVKF